MAALENAVTPDATDLEIGLVHHDDAAVPVIVVAVVPVHPEEEKMETVHVDASLHYTGMFHHPVSNILHHSNIK